MNTVYFKTLGVHEYGWYAYAEGDVFILGDDYPHEGGELYRGEFKEDRIPYLNAFKKDCPEAYDNAVRYFKSRLENNKSDAMFMWARVEDKPIPTFGMHGKSFLLKLQYRNYYGLNAPNNSEVVTAIWDSVNESFYESKTKKEIDDRDIAAWCEGDL